MKLGRPLKAILFVLAAELLGSVGTIATSPAIDGWYKTLTKPSFNPPNWLFGPAWTILFALMGLSAFLIYEKGFKKKEVRSALKVFALQFVFNVAWSFIFFGGRMIGVALIEIVIMWFLILATIVKFNRISKTAGLLLIPYLLWVTFATILNAAIGLLNGF
jgi:tryptophan-rich sensory protein